MKKSNPASENTENAPPTGGTVGDVHTDASRDPQEPSVVAGGGQPAVADPVSPGVSRPTQPVPQQIAALARAVSKTWNIPTSIILAFWCALAKHAAATGNNPFGLIATGTERRDGDGHVIYDHVGYAFQHFGVVLGSRAPYAALRQTYMTGKLKTSSYLTSLADEWAERNPIPGVSAKDIVAAHADNNLTIYDK